MKNLKEETETLFEELVALRRDFHKYPELGFQEFRTAEKIEQYLQNLGLETKRVAGTGVVATLFGKKNGKTILLRADMDAMPVDEENEVPYRSTAKNISHCCGHDAHSAMLLITAKILVSHKNELNGNVKFVFQPNEEIGGAEQMVKEGVLSSPKVDAAVGCHIWSFLETGKIGIKTGGVMANMDVFKIRVIGKDGHTGAPENAIDPIIAAASIITETQKIQTRDISLLKPTVIMFSKISSGALKVNIIPENAYLEGTIRYLHEPAKDLNDSPKKLFKKVVEDVCRVYSCMYELEMEEENHVVINDNKMVDLAKKVYRRSVGTDSDILDYASLASEDFSSFSSRVPSVFVHLGCRNKKKGADYPHHNSKFNIDEDAMKSGVEFYVGMVDEFLNDR